jgi:hypothetical protein
MTLINSFLLTLFLTIVIELAVAYFFGFRKKTEIITIILINIITNPVLNYLFLINDHYSLIKINSLMIIILELAVVFVEWKLLFYSLQENSKKMLNVSLAMNFCSYVAGFVIFR